MSRSLFLDTWEKSWSSKAVSGLPPLPPQNSAEPLGLCRRVLQKSLHSRKPAEEPSHRTLKVLQNFGSQAQLFGPECTKIARFSAVAAAIFTAPPQNRSIFKAPRCAISSAKKIASERRFSLRLKGTNLIPTAEFPAIPESAAKIASERRCAILVHSGSDP